MSETTRTVTVAHRRLELRTSQVERALRAVLPEPVREHFVVVNGRRYPPKQVVALVSGLDRAEFTSHHARRILAGLGFPAGRRGAPARTSSSGSTRRTSRSDAVAARPAPETLEPFTGQWVATRGAEVLVAAREPRDVVGWLSEHHEPADSMFRVPRDHTQAGGLGPS